jgi:hypothetical protein
VFGVFKEMLRQRHVLLSVFYTRGEAQAVLTLPQRVMVSATL